MAETSHYAIQGGLQGRERLRVLGRVVRPSTLTLFERLGACDGRQCLDAGCGGGDATLDLARLVGPRGTVLGVDLDEVKVRLARDEAAQQGVSNVEFKQADARTHAEPNAFDIIYARFLLTHLSDPSATVETFHDLLRPGGVIGVEDIDFSGHFVYPDLPSFHRYADLYCTTVKRRGGDPNIGPRLPLLLAAAGFEDVQMAIVQPAGTTGEAKLMNPLTMENIAGAVLADGLATKEEVEGIVRELYAFAADPNTVAGMPRVVQAWGRKRAR